ncbi:MAG: hypothetical protein MJA27_07485 [Pseudanabaenales cyanobacterium]|nr:hypothetical protein [Pseudanabaenales cyanobacterium]
MIPSLANPPSQIEYCKVVVFQILGHWLALPTSAVLKITRLPTPVNGGVEANGLTMWNNCPLVFLDLHALLAPKQYQLPPPESHSSGCLRFVIIAQSQATEPCAIPVDKPPTLMEIPLSEIQILPPHYHQVIGGIAGHVAVLPHQGSILNILLLNLQQALNKTLQKF